MTNTLTELTTALLSGVGDILNTDVAKFLAAGLVLCVCIGILKAFLPR